MNASDNDSIEGTTEGRIQYLTFLFLPQPLVIGLDLIHVKRYNKNAFQ